MIVGSDQTRLIVLRGNSGSGKSTVALALRAAQQHRIAWVSQDLIRRSILKERDAPGAASIGLIDQIVRYGLNHGYHVLVDGILYASHYEEMLLRLSRCHAGHSLFYYLDVSFDETLRRHRARPQVSEFGAEEMGAWYRPRDLLAAVPEHIIHESSTLDQTTNLILAESGLAEPGACGGPHCCAALPLSTQPRPVRPP
jgi:predicted kinase